MGNRPGVQLRNDEQLIVLCQQLGVELARIQFYRGRCRPREMASRPLRQCSDRESSRVSCELPLENKCGHAHKTNATSGGPTLGHSCTVRRFQSPLGDPQWANDSLPHAGPHDGPSVGLPFSTAPADILSCFAAPSSGSDSQQPALGDPQCQRARGSDAPCGLKSGPNTLSVSAPASASLPLAGQAYHDRPVSAAQRRQTIRERDTEGTASSFGDVPSHRPHAVPNHLRFRQQDRPCSVFALGRLSGRLTRGERRPLRSKTSTQAWSTSVPCGDVAPPRSNSQLEIGPAP